jgi:hypothetical protein
VVDDGDSHGDMYELDEIPDESHDGESHGYSAAELDVFYSNANDGRGRRCRCGT